MGGRGPRLGGAWAGAAWLALAFIAPSPAEAGEALPLEGARELAVRAADAPTRRQAVMALGEQGTLGDAPILVQALRDTDEGVRALADLALWAVFLRSGDPEVDRLTQEGIERIRRGDLEEAVALFSQIIARAPGFAEGYNKRATAYYLMGRHRESLEDCERTLARNPWHFGALSGMGLIYAALDEPRRALEAFEKALAVHPSLEGARRNAEALRELLAARRRNSL